MALYGPNGDKAFVATVKESSQDNRSFLWLGWLVSLVILGLGLADHRPFLVIVGGLGAGQASWMTVRRWRRLAIIRRLRRRSR